MTHSPQQEPELVRPPRQESWEIEILISGGAFVSLYQLSNNLNVFVGNLEVSAALKMFMLATAGGLRMLSIYFVAHLCLRAFWLSLVLLRKVYPEGTNTFNLGFREPYQTLAKKFQLDERIARMDTLSGLTFAWSVFFVITFLGFGFALALVGGTALYLAEVLGWRENPVFDVIRKTVLLTAVLFLLDTMAFGPLRRTRVLSKVYYPIYIFWNFLTLGSLWRPAIQSIFSNVRNKGRAFVVALLSVAAVFFLSGDEEDFGGLFRSSDNFHERETIDDIRYLDRRRPDQLIGTAIQSDVVTDGFLRLYVHYNQFDDAQLDTTKTGRQYFSQLIRVTVDDSAYHSLAWAGISRSTGQRGIQTIVDVSHLRKDLHVLKVERTYGDSVMVEIPFWKQ